MLSMYWAVFGLVLVCLATWIVYQYDGGGSAVVVRDVLKLSFATTCAVVGVVLVVLAKPRKD